MTELIDSFSWSQVFRATMVLFAVIDIIGSIPLIIKVQEKSGYVSPMRTSIVSFGIMLGFLILGESILNIFGVDIRSFAVAGSIIIFALALEMIMGWDLFRDEASSKVASVIPLAFPIIAGAGTLTTLVALKAEYHEINILVAIVINVVIIFTVLKLTKKIEHILGEGGIGIVKKVFGIILLAIALKLFSSNITFLFAK
ncbi:MAG TPA: MarC family protein [Taishania sp.]|nr:MarC family protein [Taishania sp.]HNS41581.1 MarC family protein [Taishania sp.]